MLLCFLRLAEACAINSGCGMQLAPFLNMLEAWDKALPKASALHTSIMPVIDQIQGTLQKFRPLVSGSGRSAHPLFS